MSLNKHYRSDTSELDREQDEDGQKHEKGESEADRRGNNTENEGVRLCFRFPLQSSSL